MKIHRPEAYHSFDSIRRSISLGRMPFPDANTSSGILVHRLDLHRRANSPHCISCFCCRSPIRGSHQSQQPQFRGPAMARNVVLLARTRIRASAEYLGFSHPVSCEYRGGRLAHRGICRDYRYPGSHDRGEAHRIICLHRGFQHEWVAVRWDIVVSGALVNRLSIPWVSF